METPSRHSFDLDGSLRVFPIPSPIKGDNYCRLEVDGVIVNDRAKYDIVNNSIVFISVADVPNGSQLDVLVVQSEESIGQLAITTNIDIVATNIADINTVGLNILDVNTVADADADIALLADIQDGTVATNALTNLNTIRTDVTTVSGISGNVTTVAGNTANVNTVAGNTANINVVSGISGNVTTVAGISANVTAVAGNATNINAVVADDIDIGIVATNIDSVNTVAGISGNVTTVANNDANVSTVAGISGNVTTVAGISANVTTVAGNTSNINAVVANQANINAAVADATDIGAVASNIANVNIAAGNTTNINAAVANTSNINAVVADAADIGTVASNIANVNTVATNNANVTTVAGINANVTTVAGISANVTTVATNNANVTAVGTNIADVSLVAAEISNNNLQTIAADIAAVITVANDLTEASSEIDTVANSIANVDAVGGSIANVNTVATNIADVNNFADTYAIGATAPAGPTVGDLWFDTSAQAMKVYGSSGWQNAGSSVNGTAERVTYTATAAQTTFAATYDAGYVDVWMNGIKLTAGTDFTATNGTSIVLAVGAGAGDLLDIVGYGTFELANFAIGDANNVSTSGITDGQVLAYNNATGIFEPSDGFDASTLATVATTGAYSDLTGTPTLATVATTGAYADVTGTPTLATVATTGAYGDLSGTPAAALPLAGGTLTGNVNLGDNVKANFGASNDLQIYHDGANSYIDDTGTGNLLLRGASSVRFQSLAGENMVVADQNGAVFVYHDNAVKLATTATGIDVTGNATFPDGGKAVFGAGSDLEIYHDGSNSNIKDVGTGFLSLDTDGSDIRLTSDGQLKTMGYFAKNGAVNLYHNGNEKLATTATGISVTGGAALSGGLTGVTSIDATTVASLAAAGVGGSITDLGKTTFSGSMSYYDVTLPSGYNHHRLVIDSPVGNTSWYPIKNRFLDSSNNLLVNALYQFNRVHNQHTRVDENWFDLFEAQYGQASPTIGDYLRVQMDIYYANDSTQFTKIHTFGMARSVNFSGHVGVMASGFYKSNIVTPTIRFYQDNSSMATVSGNYVQKYGIK